MSKKTRSSSFSSPRSALPVASLVILISSLASFTASARGGSSLGVTTTATVNGTVVSGTITITNSAGTAQTVTSLSDWLEVRYPSGAATPNYATGSTVDSFRVGPVAIALPASIPAYGTLTLSFTKSLCELANYSGAKDMRNAVSVNADSPSRSATFIPTAQAYNCAVCGNGIVEAGEQCDGTACCSPTCSFRSNGSTCSDGNACTQIDSCQAGACVGTTPVVCGASDVCHLAGACDPNNGSCSNPTKVNGSVCEDGNVCTDNVCYQGSCLISANAAPCEDGNACTTNDTCAAGACVAGGPVDCNDHQSCSADTCVAATGCAHSNTLACDVCNAPECNGCQATCVTDCHSRVMQSMFACIAGCTSTYCASFCQADATVADNACSTTGSIVCRTACESGNGCRPGCIQ